MKFWVYLFAAAMLSGCATKAYRAVERECSPAAFADYPENKIQVIETRQRVIHVATGLRNCYTSKEGNQTRTTCTDVTRPEFITYREAVVVDQNEAVRNMAIASCSANLCMQRYGNAKCKTDQLLVPLQSTEPAPFPVPVPQPISVQ